MPEITSSQKDEANAPARPSADNTVYPSLPQNALIKLYSTGHQKCVSQYYTTNCIETNDGYINNILKSVNENAFIFLETWNEIKFVRCTSLRQGQKREEQRPAITWEEPKPLKGDYLVLSVPYVEEIDPAERDGYRISSLLRAFFGDLFAKELHAWVSYEFSETGTVITNTSKPAYIYPFSDNVYDDFVSCRKEVDFTVDSNPRALELLFDANEQIDPFISFTLLWLAVEAQLSDHGGQRSGERRRKFINESLRSRVIDSEVQRLFGIRCECFKSSARVSITEFDKYSVISFLRLAMLKDSEMRRELIKAYEKAILKEKG